MGIRSHPSPKGAGVGRCGLEPGGSHSHGGGTAWQVWPQRNGSVAGLAWGGRGVGPLTKPYFKPIGQGSLVRQPLEGTSPETEQDKEGWRMESEGEWRRASQGTHVTVGHQGETSLTASLLFFKPMKSVDPSRKSCGRACMPCIRSDAVCILSPPAELWAGCALSPCPGPGGCSLCCLPAPSLFLGPRFSLRLSGNILQEITWKAFMGHMFSEPFMSENGCTLTRD